MSTASVAERYRTPLVALAYAILAAALFWRAVLGLGVLSVPAGSLFAPWNGSSGAGASRAFSNPELHDLARVFFAWQRQARTQVLAGHLPAWNPYAGAGAPFFANPQTQVASPFALALYLLPFPYGLGAMAVLRVWVAALGTFLLARRLGCTRSGAFVAGLAFGGSAFETVWAGHPLAGVFALLPWMLVACERVLRQGRRRDVALLVLAVAAAGLAGHPGSFADALLALALYVVVRSLVTAPIRVASLLVPLARVLAGMLGGVALAAVALLPAYLAIRGTVGVQARAGGGPTLPLSTARTLLYPFWWGRPTSGEFGRPPLNANERTVFAGVLPLLLAATALTARTSWRRVAAPGALVVLAAGATYGIPPLIELVRVIPGVDESPVRRLQAVLELAIAVLAGIGLDGLRRRSLALLLVATAATGVGALVWLQRRDVSGVLSLTVRHTLPSDARSAAAAAVGWSLVVVVAAAAALLVAWRRPRLLAALLCTASLVDVGGVAYGYQQTPPARLVFGRTPPSLRYLQEHAGHYRVTGLWDTLPPDTAMIYRLRDIREYDPPQPATAYAHAFQLIDPAHIGYWLTIAGIRPAGRPLLDLLGVRYVIGPANRPAPRAAGLRLVYSGSDAKIVENLQARPRATIPVSVRMVRDGRVALADLSVVRDGATVSGGAHVAAGRGHVRITRDGDSRVDLEASMRRGGLVVLADSWAPGWSVTVDGHPARAVRVDTVVRGVVVPTGNHHVTWSYSVPGLRTGAAATLAAIILLALLLVPGRLSFRGRPRVSGADV